MAVRVRFSLLAPPISLPVTPFLGVPKSRMKIAVISDFLLSPGGRMMKLIRKPTLFGLALIISTLICHSEPKGQDLKLNDKNLFDYATHLYKQGEYFRAITEYNRILYFYPDSNLKNDAKLQIGRAYMAGDSLDDAIEFWDLQLQEVETDHENFATIKTLLGISLLDLDQTTIFSFREKNIEKAVHLFDDLAAMSPGNRIFSDFTHEWRRSDFSGENSPLLAGSMSVVLPGSGSFYTGRYLEGIYSFFITGLFYLATRDAIANENDELGYLFGFLTLGFYGGNIYAAVNGAYKTNDFVRSETLMRLRQKHGIWFIPARENYPGRY
jgi:tetratricopeptide (TPR) repeat protein